MRENFDLLRCCSCCCCYCCDIFAWVMSRHHWFGHYPEQNRSSETIGLRTKDTLQLHKTKQTFYQVQFNWKKKKEYKCYKNTNTTQSVCEPLSEPMMQESLWSVLECYPHNLWRYIKLVNLNLDYRRIYASLGLNELRPRKIMNCQSPGDFLIKLVF